MADEVVAVLVEEISRILMSHFNLIHNEAIEELKMLKNGLWLLKALAEKATGMRELELARQIKEVVYDVEDASESWLMDSVAAAAKNKIFRGFLMAKQGNALARKIKSIRDGRLEPLNRRIRTYRDLLIVQVQPTEASEVNSPLPLLFFFQLNCLVIILTHLLSFFPSTFLAEILFSDFKCSNPSNFKEDQV